MSWRDYSRYRLSVFSREEASGIVAYLRWRAGRTEDDRLNIEHALTGFWLDRAQRAPTTAELEAHIQNEQAYAEACMRDRASSGP